MSAKRSPRALMRAVAAAALLLAGLALLSSPSSLPSLSSRGGGGGSGGGRFLILRSVGKAGFNNQRAVLMLAAWAAKELGLDLRIPRHFNANLHHEPDIPIEDAFDLDAIREYVGGDVGYLDDDEDDDAAAAEGDDAATVVRIEVNQRCTDLLTGDLLHSLVETELAQREAASGGRDDNRTSAAVVRYDVELSLFQYIILNSAFPPTPSGRAVVRDLFAAFRHAADVRRCADLALESVLRPACPEGIHAAHLRVGDRHPTPLFDCSRGREVIGRDLEEKRGDCSCYSGNQSEGENLRLEEVLERDLPEGRPGRGQCVYVATNGPKSEWMTQFRDWAGKGGGNGIEVLTYEDVSKSEAMRAAGCLREDGGGGPNPSIFEQALVSRVPGRYAAMFESSWDAYVVHARTWRGEEERTGEGMLLAQRELELFQSKYAKRTARWKNKKERAWCLRPVRGAAKASSRRMRGADGSEEEDVAFE